MAALRSKTDVEAVTQQRQALIVQATVSDLLGKAKTALTESHSSLGQNLIKKQPAYDKPTIDARAKARNYAERALALDPLSVWAKEVMAEILNSEGIRFDENSEHEAAADKLRSAIKPYPDKLHPSYAFYHWNLANVLLHDGDIKSALAPGRAQFLPCSKHLLKGAVKVVLHCAHRTRTVSSCAFCEQGGHLTAPLSPPSFANISS